jgi:hypothetical protein
MEIKKYTPCGVLEILFPLSGVKSFVKILICLKRGLKMSTPQGGIAMNPGFLPVYKSKKKPNYLIFKAARLSIEIRSFPSLSHGRFGFVFSQLQWMFSCYFMTNLKKRQWHQVVYFLLEKRNSTGALLKICNFSRMAKYACRKMNVLFS